MHDPDVIVFLDRSVPPIPNPAMALGVRKCVQMVKGFPIRKGHYNVACVILDANEVARFSENYNRRFY